MTGVVNPNVSLIGQHEVGIDSYGTYNDLAWYMIERAASKRRTQTMRGLIRAVDRFVFGFEDFFLCCFGV